jgi:hypothetical protein
MLVAKPSPPEGADGGRGMRFEDWLFWMAFSGFLGCNIGLLVWILLR